RSRSRRRVGHAPAAGARAVEQPHGRAARGARRRVAARAVPAGFPGRAPLDHPAPGCRAPARPDRPRLRPGRVAQHLHACPRRGLGRGLAALHDPCKVAAGVSLSLGAWLAELAALRVLCAALAFAPSPARLVLVLAALNLGISVPIGVANLGVYEAVLSLGLTRSGIPLATAAAIATLHHALQLLGTNVGAAGLSLWAAGRCPRPP